MLLFFSSVLLWKGLDLVFGIVGRTYFAKTVNSRSFVRSNDYKLERIAFFCGSMHSEREIHTQPAQCKGNCRQKIPLKLQKI